MVEQYKKVAAMLLEKVMARSYKSLKVTALKVLQNIVVFLQGLEPFQDKYGSYHYKSERSKHESDWPITGFSQPKQHTILYIISKADNYEESLGKPSKYKISPESCIYINTIKDIYLNILENLC